MLLAVRSVSYVFLSPSRLSRVCSALSLSFSLYPLLLLHPRLARQRDTTRIARKGFAKGGVPAGGCSSALRVYSEGEKEEEESACVRMRAGATVARRVRREVRSGILQAQARSSSSTTVTSSCHVIPLGRRHPDGPENSVIPMCLIDPAGRASSRSNYC